MGTPLQLRHERGRHIEVLTRSGILLWRYVYMPDTPANEAPRPYAHPVNTTAGDLVSNFRPNDHPWHHGLSFTLTSVSGVNFWGGPSYRAGEGYRFEDNHGAQVHREWTTLTAETLESVLDWRERVSGVALLEETRRHEIQFVRPGMWTLRWTSRLTNVSGRDLSLGNYHSDHGLAGSHYTGLQFRGSRDLLDDHGDGTIGIAAEGGLAGEAAVHGASAPWMEWSCQHDGTLRRTRIRFESLTDPLPWFVRRKNPIAAFAFHREQPHPLASGATLTLDHRLTFTTE